jgi:hypothetical protein
MQVSCCFTSLAFSQPNPRAAHVIKGARWGTGGGKVTRFKKANAGKKATRPQGKEGKRKAENRKRKGAHGENENCQNKAICQHVFTQNRIPTLKTQISRPSPTLRAAFVYPSSPSWRLPLAADGWSFVGIPHCDPFARPIGGQLHGAVAVGEKRSLLRIVAW